MITIKDFFELIEYRISTGYEYQWDCFGTNVHALSYEDENNNGTSVSVVFDTVDQTVYSMEAWDGRKDRQYRWIHPDFLEDYKAESKSRNVDYHTSIDDSKYIDLEMEDDILEKADAIYRGEEYDQRVMIQLEMNHEEEHMLMQLAHEADMSLNQFIEHILLIKIKELQAS